MAQQQSFKRHARIVPMYHYVTWLLVVVYLGWTIWRVVQLPSLETGMGVIPAVALALIAFYARTFALRAQDRVIRLEMRVRLQELLQPDLRARIGELTVAQCIALRFASDAELPALVAEVLKSDLQDQQAIKKMIKNWTADHVRV